LEDYRKFRRKGRLLALSRPGKKKRKTPRRNSEKWKRGGKRRGNALFATGEDTARSSASRRVLPLEKEKKMIAVTKEKRKKKKEGKKNNDGLFCGGDQERRRRTTLIHPKSEGTKVTKEMSSIHKSEGNPSPLRRRFTNRKAGSRTISFAKAKKAIKERYEGRLVTEATCAGKKGRDIQQRSVARPTSIGEDEKPRRGKDAGRKKEKKRREKPSPLSWPRRGKRQLPPVLSSPRDAKRGGKKRGANTPRVRRKRKKKEEKKGGVLLPRFVPVKGVGGG